MTDRSHRSAMGLGGVVGSYALIVAVIAIDWMTPAGIVVGLLLSIPIILLSLQNSRMQVLAAWGVGLVGFVVAARFGAEPISPVGVWLTNRIIAAIGIAASGPLSLVLQRHRVAADAALDAALDARDMNGLLMKLMAHDLRTPLVASVDALGYVERCVSNDDPIDVELLADTRLRLRRNLRAIEAVLQLARSDLETAATARGNDPSSLDRAIAGEVASFRDEAAASGKRLTVRTARLDGRAMGFDPLILRQALGILIDNAIRYADPGTIAVEATVRGDRLAVRVADPGPGLSASRDRESRGAGSHLGLDLCRALIARARGALQLERDGEHGTVFCILLPLADGVTSSEPRSAAEGQTSLSPEAQPV